MAYASTALQTQIESYRSPMARKSTLNELLLTPFAKWLWGNINRRGFTVQRVADEAGMHVSHLHKVLKSYLPLYAEYQRPGYEKTVLIGQLFHDVPGALRSAGYTPPETAPETAAEAAGHEITMEELDIEYAPSWHLLTPADKQVVKAVIDGLNARADAQEAAERAERAEKKAAGCC